MRAYELEAFGIENLKCVERPAPEPAAGEVKIRLRAVSLNFRDYLIIQGKYDPRLKMPRVPISDGAGEVVKVGDGVTAFKAGERVVIPFMPGWLDGELSAAKSATALGGAVDGVLQEFVVIPESALLGLPAPLNFNQAATLPCAAVTAWNGLFVSGNLQPGQTVLLQGTGSVSLFGLQFAKIIGAKAIITSSSNEKLERTKRMGADHTINYRTEPDWEKRVLEITEGRGVDLTLEVGGIGTLSRTMKATKFAGNISLIGVLAGISGEVQVGSLLHKALTIRGIYVGSREMFAAMNATIVQHELQPVIDRVFPFAESVEALRYFATGRHFGKVVVRFD